MRKAPEISLRIRAMRYLARREHSRVELRSKLLRHVQEGEDVDALLDELEKQNWLSDIRAAEMMINAKRSRFGSQRIAHELRQKGIDKNIVNAALPGLQEEELTTAQEVWQKKFGVFPATRQEKAKQVRFLQSRGFSLDVIFNTLKMAEDA